MNDYKLGHAALQKTADSKTQTRAQREDGRGIVIAPTNKDIGNFVEGREAFGVGHGLEALEQNTSHLRFLRFTPTHEPELLS